MKNNNQNPEKDQKKTQKESSPESPNKGNNNFNVGGKKFNIYWIYILIILGILALNLFYTTKEPVETTWQDVRGQMIKDGDIKKLVVVRNSGKVEVYIKDNNLSKYSAKIGEDAEKVNKQGPTSSLP